MSVRPAFGHRDDLRQRARPDARPNHRYPMKKTRLTPLIATTLLISAASPAHADGTGCDAKLAALDARIAAAREQRAMERVARLRAVRQRVRHFCAGGDIQAQAAPGAGPDAANRQPAP